MLGIIFYQTDTKTIKRLEAAIAFPSPYWGLFFYRQLEQEIYNLYVLVSVPILGIIFYPNLLDYIDDWNGDKFPSPYWGLFFINCIKCRLKDHNACSQFPSPYWGLFFISTLYSYDN